MRDSIEVIAFKLEGVRQLMAMLQLTCDLLPVREEVLELGYISLTECIEQLQELTSSADLQTE